MHRTEWARCFLVLLVLATGACYYEGFHTPDEAVLGIQQSLLADAADPADAAAETYSSARVLLLHGIGCHRTGWSLELQSKITTQLGMREVDYAATARPELRRMLLEVDVVEGLVTPVHTYYEPEVLPLGSYARRCPEPATDDDHPTLLVRHYRDDAGRLLSFYEVTWSPIAERRKRSSILAEDGEAAPPRAGGFSGPAIFNRRLKREIIDRRLSDAVIYLGAERQNVLALIRDALCRTWRSAVSDEPCNPRDPSVAAGMGAHRYSIVAASLGSRIAFDVLASQELRGVADRMLRRTDAIFMLANQVPLLELAGRSLDGTIAEATDPLGGEVETAVARLRAHGIGCAEDEVDCDASAREADGLFAALERQRRRLTEETQRRLYDAVAERDEQLARQEHLDAVARYDEASDDLESRTADAERLRTVDLPRQEAGLRAANTSLAGASADFDQTEAAWKSHDSAGKDLERQRGDLEARRAENEKRRLALRREQWGGVGSVVRSMTGLSLALTELQQRRHELIHAQLGDEDDADLRLMPAAGTTAKRGAGALAWMEGVWRRAVRRHGSEPRAIQLARQAFEEQETQRQAADRKVEKGGEEVGCPGWFGLFPGCSRKDLEERRERVRSAGTEVEAATRRCCTELRDAAFTLEVSLAGDGFATHCAEQAGGGQPTPGAALGRQMEAAEVQAEELERLLEAQQQAQQLWDQTQRPLADLLAAARHRLETARSEVDAAQEALRGTRAELRRLERLIEDLSDEVEELADAVELSEEKYRQAVARRQELARTRPAGIAAFDRLMLTSPSALLLAQIDALAKLKDALEGDPGGRGGLVQVLEAVSERLERASRERKLQIVALSDTNDLLSYSLGRRLEEQLQFVDFINVPVQLTPQLLGLWANPVAAHSGHLKNRNVVRLMSCGAVPDANGRFRVGDCGVHPRLHEAQPAGSSTKEEETH